MTEGIDPGRIGSAEELDEDRLHVDPLEDGMDPPEHWTQADKYGNTPYEQSHPRDLDQRLAEEQPEALPNGDAPTPAETPDDELDESIDDLTDDVEAFPPPEEVPGSSTDAVRRGQSADEAGGSIAEEIRTPHD
jgi:hypothetical protein